MIFCAWITSGVSEGPFRWIDMFEVRVAKKKSGATLDFFHPETHHLKDSEHVGMCCVCMWPVVNPIYSWYTIPNRGVWLGLPHWSTCGLGPCDPSASQAEPENEYHLPPVGEVSLQDWQIAAGDEMRRLWLLKSFGAKRTWVFLKIRVPQAIGLPITQWSMMINRPILNNFWDPFLGFSSFVAPILRGSMVLRLVGLWRCPQPAEGMTTYWTFWMLTPQSWLVCATIGDFSNPPLVCSQWVWGVSLASLDVWTYPTELQLMIDCSCQHDAWWLGWGSLLTSTFAGEISRCSVALLLVSSRNLLFGSLGDWEHPTTSSHLFGTWTAGYHSFGPSHILLLGIALLNFIATINESIYHP